MWDSVSNIVDLTIPFLVLVIVAYGATRATKILESFIKDIPYLPDKFEPPLVYFLVCIMGFIFCWRGQWSLFQYLDVHFINEWEGWIASSIIISSGLVGLKEIFSAIETIPSAIRGVRSIGVSKLNSKTELENYNDNNYYDSRI